jgi:hypothetical protein
MRNHHLRANRQMFHLVTLFLHTLKSSKKRSFPASAECAIEVLAAFISDTHLKWTDPSLTRSKEPEIWKVVPRLDGFCGSRDPLQTLL